jgi:ABC-2 type transport system permease protein
VASARLAAYRHIVAAQVRAQAQYRASFALDVAGSVGFGVLDLVAVAVLFNVTRSLAGFTFREVFLMMAIANVGFAVADVIVGNVERLRVYVRTGLLDAVLVRPLGVLGQLAAIDVAPRRLGRVAFSLVVIVVAVAQAGVTPTPAHVALLVLAPLAGAVIFSAVFVGTAAVAFWWIEAGELGNALTYGGHDFATYPITIYGAIFRRVLAYGLGFAFVAYYPALAVLDRADPLGAPAYLGYLSPVVASLVALAAAGVWRAGVRHYTSTGS